MRTVEQMIQEFSRYCVKYTDISVQTVFNRYVKILNEKEIKALTPYFFLLLKTGESCRTAPEQIQKSLLEHGGE